MAVCNRVQPTQNRSCWCRSQSTLGSVDRRRSWKLDPVQKPLLILSQPRENEPRSQIYKKKLFHQPAPAASFLSTLTNIANSQLHFLRFPRASWILFFLPVSPVTSRLFLVPKVIWVWSLLPTDTIIRSVMRNSRSLFILSAQGL